MALSSTKDLLLDAQKNGYAVCAFNAENMEMCMAIIKTAERLSAPVIIQTTPSTLGYAEPEIFAAMVKAMVRECKTPVALHLDHGNSYELALRCADAGYSSVMIDGSKLPFGENVCLAKRVVAHCSAAGIPVEAELGTVGGKEDSLHCDGPVYTEPADAARFVELTDIDALAVAIGTAHGIYKGTPHLDLERLSEIRKVVQIPLVLHGTSGVPAETVRECIRRGICKVNYATDLRIAYTDGIRAYLQQNPEAFDPKKHGAAGMEKVCACVESRILLCGSAQKA